ncbi:hypothetical protein IE53DRAFT_409280 [Violaceomyces palustris]|uniref:Uncharacterized protein n=1 Tax=Violaceomyces palustris TaxID=1673888 RepID=A0ACD0P3N4_9BASI|nr:hypothetical protein IE53DRAFT_409280 [Violaceomyces palustris]
MSASFTPKHHLLNPNFESYRLIQEDQDEQQSVSQTFSQQTFPLLSRPLDLNQIFDNPIGGPSSSTNLGYKEMKDRAYTQLLAPSSHACSDEPLQGLAGGYVDSNGFVVLISLNGDTKPSYHPVHRLDRYEPGLPFCSGSSPCLPSLTSLTSSIWMASSGFGTLTILKAFKQRGLSTNQHRWAVKEVSKHELLSEDGDLVPFRPLGAKVEELSNPAGGKRFKISTMLQSPRKVTGFKSDVGPMGGLGSARGRTTFEARPISGSTKTVFDVRMVTILADIDATEVTDGEAAMDVDRSVEAETLQVNWCVTGEEPAYYSHFDEDGRRCVLGAEASFTISSSKSVPSHDQTNQGGNETSGGAFPGLEPQPGRPSAAPTFEPRRPPPYSWAQTSDTLTVAFSLPPTLTKSAFRIHFSLKGLSISLTDAAATALSRPRLVEITEGQSEEMSHSKTDPLQETADKIIWGHYESRPLWGEVDPSGSVWTWEKVLGTGPMKGQELGVLTLHLEKKFEGTRWPHVFGGSGKRKWGARRDQEERVSSFRRATEQFEAVKRGEDQAGEEEEQEEEEDEEEEVPETLDPSELLDMLEGLEKYTVDEEMPSAASLGPITSSLGTASGNASGGGRGIESASLLRDGLEEEDESVGRKMILTWVENFDGSGKEEIELKRPPMDLSIDRNVLALPLPSARSEDQVTIKSDLDGLVFSPPGEGSMEWDHVDTLPALSFVLASKRDAGKVFVHRPRPTRASPGAGEGISDHESVVLAFESSPGGLGRGSSSEGGEGAGNLFVYYGPSEERAGSKQNQGKSRVIRLGSRDGFYDPSSADCGTSGSLVGVASSFVRRNDEDEYGGQGKGGKEEEVLLCLCEKGLIILKGVL